MEQLALAESDEICDECDYFRILIMNLVSQTKSLCGDDAFDTCDTITNMYSNIIKNLITISNVVPQKSQIELEMITTYKLFDECYNRIQYMKNYIDKMHNILGGSNNKYIITTTSFLAMLSMDVLTSKRLWVDAVCT